MRAAIVVLIGLVTTILPANAEMERIARFNENNHLHTYWWPKLKPINDWHHDRGSSLKNAVNALAPDGFTFVNAETVMYARAIYKPRDPEIKSLRQLIDRDNAMFRKRGFVTDIKETRSLKTGDGQALRSFKLLPREGRPWERVSFGEEGEYYILFVVSSRTRAGYEKSMKAYKQMIRSYTEKP